MDELGIYPFANTQSIYNDSLISNLCSGLRSIYITDANNCESYLYPAGIAGNEALLFRIDADEKQGVLENLKNG